MRYGSILLLSSILLLFVSEACAGGCGSNWLGGDLIGSDTVTPVGYDRPWLENPKPSSLRSNHVDTSPAQESFQAEEGLTGDDSSANESVAEDAAIEDVEISGRWSIELVDIKSYVDLMLYSAGTMVYGSGNLTENNVTGLVTTRGSINDRQLRLDVISAVDGTLYTENIRYKLALKMGGNGTLSGSYDSASGSKGNVTGFIFST